MWGTDVPKASFMKVGKWLEAATSIYGVSHMYWHSFPDKNFSLG